MYEIESKLKVLLKTLRSKGYSQREIMNYIYCDVAAQNICDAPGQISCDNSILKKDIKCNTKI
jgi:hypothetical protein